MKLPLQRDALFHGSLTHPQPFPAVLAKRGELQVPPQAERSHEEREVPERGVPALSLGDELEEARWFSVDELRAAQAREHAECGDDDGGPLLSARISIARWLIEQWLAQPGRAEAAAGAP
ncbi:MAG: hypothetical protein KY442_12840 [Proteobacteria bacterium]|nr:hypothetical protein [Pseudomonadota bacterium]